MKDALRGARAEKDAFEARLKTLEKPRREAIYSSDLRASVGPCEVLITGGYVTPDGQTQFTAIEPRIEVQNGRETVCMQLRMFALSPDALKQFGLESMQTPADNTLQYGELWQEEVYHTFLQNSAANEGVSTRRAPEIITTPGRTAMIRVGDYEISATPYLVDGSDVVEVDVRIEEPNPVAMVR